MINSKFITPICLILITAVLACTLYLVYVPGDFSAEYTTGETEYGEGHKIVYTDDDYYSNYSANGVSKITLNGTGASAQSKNVSVIGSQITILGGGTYVVSGELNDGSIIVDSADSAVVRLVLSNASVTSSDYSAIYVKQAEKTVISLAEGTENFLTDASVYSQSRLAENNSNAALYSKDDLTINGKGSLTVKGNYHDGIKVNDTLKITGGSIKVTAADEAVNVNDAAAFKGTSIELESGGEALKCENEALDKGFIVLENSDIKITDCDDGIYASSSVYINGGSMEISANDDAIHAGKNVFLNPEELNIVKCFEGIEGAYVEINGGDIRITSGDDAINAIGENSTGGFGGPMGMKKENITSEDIYLTINGGNIYIETSGDGIDSNGAVLVNGGNTEVYGPENSANSSLDFEYGFIINGGSVMAAGASGMAELPSEQSQQSSAVFYLDQSFEGGSSILLTDESKNTVMSSVSGKRFNWVCVSSGDIAVGKSYTLSINGTKISTAEITGPVTSVGGRR